MATLFGTKAIAKKHFGSKEISKEVLNGSVVYEKGGSIVIDPVLGNNSWETIRQACKTGVAANYWSVGATKQCTGGDGHARPVGLMNLSGGRCVFQFRYRTENNYVWQSTAIDGYYNNYSTSKMRTVHLASGGQPRADLLDSELAAVLEPMSYQVATNSSDGTLLTLSDDLWLAAEKEVTKTRAYSTQTEFDALTTFDFYAANDNNQSRMIPRPTAVGQTSGNIWWLRSPYSGYTNIVCGVNSSGDVGSYSASYSYGVAPCFGWQSQN